MTNKNAKIMEGIVNRMTSVADFFDLARKEAPMKENCFHCIQRAVGDCPLFSYDGDIETLMLADHEAFKMVASYCATGCGTFKGE